MTALNRVQLIGYLGKEPETRFTPNGKRVAHFSMGVTQRWKTGNETRESTEWVNIEAWGRLGEVAQQYLKKGSLAYVEGRLKTDKYEAKAGDTRYFSKVVASGLQLLDRKPADEPVMETEEEPAGFEA
jgi:single-strand DNA-binding protein